MSRPSDRLVDEHGHPLAGVHTLSRAACEDEFDYLRGELQAMAGRGEQGSDLYAAIVDRAGLLADKLDEFERLTPSRAQLRQLAGLNVTERGAFGPATVHPAGAAVTRCSSRPGPAAGSPTSRASRSAPARRSRSGAPGPAACTSRTNR
jgi:hypothetical protein